MKRLSKKLFLHVIISLVLFSSNFTTIRAASWTDTSLLLEELASHASFIYQNKLVTLAGANNLPTNKSEIASLLPDYSLDGWTFSSTNFPGGYYWHTSVVFENVIYSLGGNTFPSSTTNSDVYVGTINTDGSVLWTGLNSLPEPKAQANAVMVNNKIYLSGGFNQQNSFTLSNKVYFSNVNPDWTLGTWAETTPLPIPLFGHGMIETGSKVIVFGGRTSGFEWSSKVYESLINPDGTLSEWIEVNQLPLSAYRAGVAKVDDTVFLVGGDVNGSSVSDVYYSKILNNGSLDDWIKTTSLPEPVCCGSLASNGTHLYLTGGYNNGYLNSVYFNSISDLLTVNAPLNVPDIKQFDPLWKDVLYDTAINWSSEPTIESWGCALTSASMVLNYYNHPNTPESLNTWLNNQPDGYFGNGLVNWLAISRYSKVNNETDSQTLEFNSLAAVDSQLVTELENGRPSILKIPGHFIVATGIQGNDITVNDPASNSELLSEVELSHDKEYSQIYTFTPSNTDLSYIFLLISDGFDLEVYDPNGNLIDFGYFEENPLVSDLDNFSTTGIVLNSFYLAKPENGVYKVIVKGEGEYESSAYLYNSDGDPEMFTSEALTQNQDTLYIYFSDEEKSLVHPALIEIYELLISNKDQLGRGVFRRLHVQIDIANNAMLLNKETRAIRYLNNLRLQISIYASPLVNKISSELASSFIAQIDEAIALIENSSL